ncbi:agmatinase [Mesorhizobium australicum]
MPNTIRDFVPADAGQTPRLTEVATFMRSRTLPMEQAGEADIAIVGVPFDLGTAYHLGGSRHGPTAIRKESRGLGFIDGYKSIAPARVVDLGDVPVYPRNFDKSLDIITECFRNLAEKGALPLVLGGDHTIPLPILRGLVRSGDVGMVHFDAHSDTSDETRGMKITHGTTFRRAVEEGLVDPKRVIQIGLRGGPLYSEEDYAWAREAGMTIVTTDVFEERGRAWVIEEARRVVGNAPTYVSFDIDGLDAVYCPGTGAPEPGGFSMRDAMVMLRGLRGANIIGADICEVCPPVDSSGITALHAAHLGFELLCLLAETARNRAR